MKLNYRRTLLVGFAFLSISSFWQLYDSVIPLILKVTFDVPDDIAGVIMALDNVLALFMLPLFGKLSDKASTRFGKRTPFIVGGTLTAVVLMNLLPMMQKQSNLLGFCVVLGALLFAMGTYRSPAVALMPDVTPKPLRSKGNAVINLMGALGGVFALVMMSLVVVKTETGMEDYTLLFFAVSALMLLSVVVLVLTVRENQIAIVDEEETSVSQDGKSQALPKPVMISLVLILSSVFLWYMGYNAVISAYTKYAHEVWGQNLGSAAQMMMIATVGAVVSYLPIGILSSKWGRKRMIQGGVVLLALCFLTMIFVPSPNFGVYIVFAVMGLSWAMINVNSYPMVVEISRCGDVGKYTGYYYTFSMAAQIITPIVSGFLLEHVGYHTLFPYASLMVALSLITISLSKHGDNKPQKLASKLEAFDVGDD